MWAERERERKIERRARKSDEQERDLKNTAERERSGERAESAANSSLKPNNWRFVRYIRILQSISEFRIRTYVFLCKLMSVEYFLSTIGIFRQAYVTTWCLKNWQSTKPRRIPKLRDSEKVNMYRTRAYTCCNLVLLENDCQQNNVP